MTAEVSVVNMITTFTKSCGVWIMKFFMVYRAVCVKINKQYKYIEAHSREISKEFQASVQRYLSHIINLHIRLYLPHVGNEACLATIFPVIMTVISREVFTFCFDFRILTRARNTLSLLIFCRLINFTFV